MKISKYYLYENFDGNIDKISLLMDISRQIIKNLENKFKLINKHFMIFKQVNVSISYIKIH